jgi:glutaredoxin
MAEWYTIYTKDGCKLCLKAKELLQVMGVDFYEEILPKDDKFPTPTIFIEDSFIGDYFSLKNHFNKRLYNGSKKKKNGEQISRG